MFYLPLKVTMSTLAQLQSKYDEVTEIRETAKGDFTMSSTRKREIHEEFIAARDGEMTLEADARHRFLRSSKRTVSSFYPSALGPDASTQKSFI